jgi:TrmH family RNA methyltransferase
MLVERITSRQNPLVKRFRRVRAGGARQLIFLEGVRLIEEALRAGAHFESVAYSPALEASDRGLVLLDALQRVPCRGAHVSKQVMDAIADTENPQGVAALVSRPRFDLLEVFSDAPRLLVIADQLQDPGNLGAIIRTAEAAGADAFISTRYTVDPFNHKALRASMGSALRLPLVTDARRSDIASLCREHGIKMIAARSASARNQVKIEDAAIAEMTQVYTDADMTAPVALVLGSEATGISEEAAAAADQFVYIPMADGVESLNVATAAAILLFEVARQRDFPFTKCESD